MQAPPHVPHRPLPSFRCVGVLAALPGELGDFLPSPGQPGHGARAELGVEIHAPRLDGCPIEVLSACSGVGKVASAHAALALISAGAEALFVVGTCGGLAPSHGVGRFVHLLEAVQWDLSVRDGRESLAARELWEPWMAACPGLAGLALTADRPALRWISRLRRARAVRSRGQVESGSPPGKEGGLVPVADMETAAVGAVASRSGVPWAALRVISDAQRSLLHRATGRGRTASSFHLHYPVQAGRAAASLVSLLAPDLGDSNAEKDRPSG
ncbi:5'-methylthioadenosine/S-adenosylhomocysteine nucleosidase [Planctomycetes bacterium Poly30]|uniref:5'-methylthioadenosine/S-adenosylhomocysteine nucleosidase n=1 Tax=Saltatorellus ferox TaxID=2528018 RepID=A0A518ERR9_9BACT|nr:5'-methylthioadenosine/S-adenosylhomocysteine nucleosidase [Planctomycetes bacterium Poly30]